MSGNSDVITKIVKVASNLESKGEKLSWYVFGSYLHSPQKAKDIDILIIYENIFSPKEVRMLLSDISLLFPIDLLFMTTEEEKQFDFIRLQNVEMIYPVI